MAVSHVLLTELGGDGQVKVREPVHAEKLDDVRWRVAASPGLLIGCAAGDVLEVGDDGTFAVVERGGMLAAHIYGRGPLETSALQALRREFSEIGGVVEWPETGRFAVVTVPVDAGFPAVETLLDDFVRHNADTEWIFGNVYDAEGKPLNCW